MDGMGWLKAEPTAREAVWSVDVFPTAAEPNRVPARPQTARENASQPGSRSALAQRDK